jgi:hypothetical protein
VALNCVLDVDRDDFACHHGMADGWPTKLCAGYLAARSAPWETVKSIMFDLQAELASMGGPDEVRTAYDAWWSTVDPDRALDVYQLARLFERRRSRIEERT